MRLPRQRLAVALTFHLGDLEWIATAAARDQVDSVLRLARVSNGVAVCADGVRLHGTFGLGLDDGLYDPRTRARVADPGAFPDIDRLCQAALFAQQIADWSAYGALVTLQRIDEDALLQVLSHSGLIHCRPVLLRDALTGFASPVIDTRVIVSGDGPTRPMGLQCGDRFAVLMPVIPAPADTARIVPFVPDGAR